MKEISWDDEFTSEQELRRDNEILKEQLGISEKPFHTAINLTPYLENQFLRYIKEFEDMERGPKKEILSLFPGDFNFPSLASMSARELTTKLEEIKEILDENNIKFEFVENLPNEKIYEYFVNEELHTEIAFEFPDGMSYHINGCDGICSECFQREYCEHAQYT
jgi:hypothetical protein